MTIGNIRIIAANAGDVSTITSEATTNACLQSASFNVSPWAGAATVTTGQASPEYSDPPNACDISDVSAVASQTRYQAVTVPIPAIYYPTRQNYIISFWYRQDVPGLPRAALTVVLNGGGTPVTASLVFDKNSGHTGVFQTSFSDASGQAVISTPDKLGSGAWFVATIKIANNGTLNNLLTLTICPAYAAAGSFTADSTQTGNLICWAAQVELDSKAAIGSVPRATPPVITTTVALTASDFLSTLPVTNLQVEGRSKIARTANLVGAKYINCDVPYALASQSIKEQVSGLVLYDHNLTKYALIRLEVWSLGFHLYQFSEPEYDSGYVLALDPSNIAPVGAAGTLKVASYSRFWFPLQEMQFLRVTIVDPRNPDGYIQVKRLIFGDYFEPKVNVDYGLKMGWKDNSIQRRTQGGSLRTDNRVLYRSMSGNFGRLPEVERTALLAAMQSAGLRKEVFISAYPGAGGALERDWSMLGKFTQLPDVIADTPGNFKGSFAIESV